MSERRGAVVLSLEGETVFVPAGVAVEVAPMPRVTRVPGAPPEMLGIALHAGEVMPVLAVGASRTTMLVCSYLGEPVGVVGADVLHTGMLPCAGDHGELLLHEGKTARLLDVAALCARVQAGGWAGRLGV